MHQYSFVCCHSRPKCIKKRPNFIASKYICNLKTSSFDKAKMFKVVGLDVATVKGEEPICLMMQHWVTGGL